VASFIDMNEILGDYDLWNMIGTLAAESGAKWAAVSYVTSDDIVRFGEGDTLVVDATDSAIAEGRTDALLLERAFKRGAKLFSVDGLHSKIMVLAGKAIIGSANLSDSSVNHLHEVALVTDQAAIVAMTITMVNNLSIK
jgi:phosphatidylserine/phosphatidylglycerophosphate/cardiolipin synthase-like enzyme